MSRPHRILRAALAASLLAAASAASAAPIHVTVEAVGAAGFGPLAGATVIDFNSGLPAGPTFTSTGSGYGLYTGTTPNLAATPFGDSTQYFSTGKGATTIAFGADHTYLGLLWGSVDGYNDILFYKDGALIGTVNGSAILNPANGNQGLGGTFYVNFELYGGFDAVVLKSGNFSFEIDDLAYGRDYDVPEPAAALLFGGGLIALARARRRTR